jgi:hypothetical protein
MHKLFFAIYFFTQQTFALDQVDYDINFPNFHADSGILFDILGHEYNELLDFLPLFFAAYFL